MERPAVADHADRVLKVISGADAARSALRGLLATVRAPACARPRLPGARRSACRWRPLRKRENGSGRSCASPRLSLDRLFLAVGGVGCSVLLADRDGVVVDRRGAPVRRFHLRRLGLMDRRGVEREVRGHERHRHLPRRATRADHRSRPAFLHPQRPPQLHDRADLRRAWRTCRRHRRLLVPRRLDPGLSEFDRHGRCGRGARRSRPRISASPFPRRAFS